MRKFIGLITCLLLAVSCFAGCTIDEPVFDPNANLDTQNVFFDDFTNGVNSEDWNVMHSKWGKGNGGVIYQNVGYTADGQLVLACNGDLYDGERLGYGNDHGRRAGAAITTRKALGPGRYEVRLKCLPRFGSTTAFWTFYNNGPENHEIDIELNVNQDFKALWNTNWLTVNDNFDHFETKTDIINNDGEWHDYKFEWHTNPKRIDYYVDNILTHTSFVSVPTFAAGLNIGNWFPDGWAGAPDFETDYTFVDWFRYTPYLNNAYDVTPNSGASPQNYYPSAPIEKPVANLISNAGYDGATTAWRITKPALGSAIKNGVGLNGGKGMQVEGGDSVYQYISGISNGFEYRLTANGKAASGSGGYLLIETMPDYTVPNGIETFRIDFTEDTFKQKELVFKLTKDAWRFKVSLVANEGGTVVFDDLFLNLSKIYKA